MKEGDLIKYKIMYEKLEKKRIGLVLKKSDSNYGIKELNIFWNDGSITQTSVHIIRKVIKVISDEI